MRIPSRFIVVLLLCASLTRIEGGESLAVGSQHSVYLSAAGTVWTWGANTDGQLGLGHLDGRTWPVQVSGLGTVTAIAAGANVSLAVKSDGTVWAWGQGGYGALGQGGTNYSNSNVPVQVNGLSNVTAVAVGQYHAAALKTDGTVWCWGYNGGGESGSGSTSPSYLTTPVQALGIATATAIACGGRTTYAIEAGGSLKAWGYNFEGQVGDGSTNTTLSAPVLVKTGAATSLAGVAEIQAGYSHALARTTGGDLYSWGGNSTSALGHGAGDTTARVYATKIVAVAGMEALARLGSQSYHSGAIKGGQLYLWGYNSDGQLAKGDYAGPVGTPTLAAPAVAVKVLGASLGAATTFFQRGDGAIWGCGANDVGQLGNQESVAGLDRLWPVRVLPTWRGTLKVAAGQYHGAVLRGDGTVWSSGSGAQGQLGNNSTNPSSVPVRTGAGVAAFSALVDVAAGDDFGDFSLALKADGTVWAWGQNDSGQCGTGSVGGTVLVPSQVLVSAGTPLSDVVAVAAGDYHGLALKADGSVWAWGSSLQGQLAGTTALGGSSAYALKAMDPPPSPIVGISAGSKHSLAVRSDGFVLAWGKGTDGQLGLGPLTNTTAATYIRTEPSNGYLDQIVGISGGAQHSLFVRSDGSLWSAGSNAFGQLGLGAGSPASSTRAQLVTGLTNVAQAGAGGYMSTAIRTNGTLWTWGSGGNYATGQNVTSNIFSPTQVAGYTTVAQVDAGWSQALALLTNGVVVGWGYSGLGTNVTPAEVARTWLPTITISQPDASASEPGVDKGTLRISRSTAVVQGQAGAQLVFYTYSGSASNGTDLATLSGAATIPPESVQTDLTVTPLDDPVYEPLETAMVTLNVSNAWQVGSPSSASVNISDNDPVGFEISTSTASVVAPPTTNVTTEAGGAFTVYVRLKSRPSAALALPIGSSAPTEGLASTATLSFLSTGSDWSTWKAITITGQDDPYDDGDRPYALQFGGAVTADANFSGLKPPDLGCSNTDNDAPGVTVTQTGGGLSVTEAAGAGQSDTYTIRLTCAPPAGVTVTITVSSDGETTVTPSTLTYTDANWNLLANHAITVTAVDDDEDEALNHTSIITHTVANYGTVTVPNQTCTVVDNDTAGIVMTPVDGITTSEPGGGIKLAVSLATRPAHPVTIALATSSTEGALSATSLIFDSTGDSWKTEQYVTVTGQDDPTDDGDQNYQVTASVSASLDANFAGQTAQLTLTNSDDDSAGIRITPGTLTTSEDGTSATAAVVLTSRPLGSVTITTTLDPTPDLQHSITAGQVLVFTPGDYDTPRSLVVAGLDDGVVANVMRIRSATIAVTSGDGAAYTSAIADLVALRNQDNDSAGLVISPADFTVTEAGGAGHSQLVAIRLATLPGSDVVVNLASQDPSKATVVPAALTFTATSGTAAQQVNITAVNDDLAAGDRSTAFNLSFSTGDASYAAIAAGAYDGAIAVTVIDNDTAGIEVVPSSLRTTEAGGAQVVQVRLRSEPAFSATVSLSGVATGEGALSATTLVFDATDWSSWQTVTVTGVDDDADDGDTAWTLVCTGSGSDPAYAGLTQEVEVINEDNDSAGVVLLDEDNLPWTGALTVGEASASTAAVFRARLTSQPSAAVTVTITSSDSSEATVSPSVLTFSSSDWNDPTAHQVTVTGANDDQQDGIASFTVITGSASSADLGYHTLTVADLSGSNADDDAGRAGFELVDSATVALVGALTVSEASGTGRTTSVKIRLTSKPVATVTVFMSSSNTAEGTVSPAVLTFSSGDWDTFQPVTITASDDLVDDGPVDWIITTVAASGDGAYNTGDAGVADIAVTTSDDDTALLVLSAASATTSEAAGAERSTTLTVVLGSQPTGAVTVAISATPAAAIGSEATLSTTLLSFSTGTWFAPQTITVTGVDDSGVDGDQAWSLLAVASGGGYDSAATATVALVNRDDDVPAVQVSAATLTTAENDATTGNAATFTVQLATQPVGQVWIDLASSSATAASVAGPAGADHLVFTSSTWNQAQTVTVQGVDDTPPEYAAGGKPYTISLAVSASSALTTDGVYRTGGSAGAPVAVSDPTGTTIETDLATLTLVASSTTVSELGTSATVAVSLASRPSGDVVVYLGGSNPAAGTASPNTLTFTPSTWDQIQILTITGQDDGADTGDRPFQIDFATDGSTADPDFQAVRMALNFTCAAAINPPTLASLSTLLLTEDAVVQAITLSGIGPGQDEGPQTVTISVSSSDVSVVPTPTITYTSGDSTGSLSLTLAPEASGIAIITVTVTRDSEVAFPAFDASRVRTRSFSVLVTDLNDVPVVAVSATRAQLDPGDTITITSRLDDPVNGLLQATDADAGPDGLLFTLALPPGQGSLRRHTVVGDLGTVMSSGESISQGEVRAGLLTYSVPALSTASSDGFAVTATDGLATSSLALLAITINQSALPPVIVLSASVSSYTENAQPRLLDASPTVTDPDQSGYAGGRLAVSATGVSAGEAALDLLSIRAQGTSAGQIDVNGGSVRYGGEVFGTIAQDGVGGPLLITFTGNAAAAAVQALVANLTFAHQGDNPSATTRSLALTLTDADDQTSAPVVVTMTVVPVDDRPTVTDQTVVTSTDLAVPGLLTGSDAELAPLTWRATALPLKGTLALSATGAFIYTPDAGQYGTDSFTVIANDGGLDSLATVVPVVISGGPAARPWISSDPPLTEVAGADLRYTVVAEVGDLASAPTLNWRLVDAPAGMTITPLDATSALVRWSAVRPTGGYVSFGIQVTDGVSDQAAYQPILLLITAAPGGGG